MEREPVHAGKQRISDCIRVPLPLLEVAVGLMLLATLIWYGLDARSLPKPFNATDIGAGGFPLLIAAGTIVATLIMIGFGIVGLFGKTERDVTHWRRSLYVLITSLIFIAQAAWFETLGVYVCVGVFAAAVMLAAGERRPLHVLGVPLALVAFIYVVFAIALNVVFP
ncbi:hypothetical protein CWR43_12270 [Rhizobium sullae]|uniref:DUF1468 domain-containing protein n=1 Tax=Rhizobium sullae TaxID=50338 RepID=A0A2N0DC90_RHISU|nr:tripartite tricarboxylate transporter TctB family protein [Rhizobium sullae]PKA43704.1 hypothetical protein CWR43_12270 [Rhizobium sullae]